MSQNPTKPDKLGQVSDAVIGNWVDNVAPVKLRPYLRFVAGRSTNWNLATIDTMLVGFVSGNFARWNSFH